VEEKVEKVDEFGAVPSAEISQIMTVFSSELEAICVPSGEKESPQTKFVCFDNGPNTRSPDCKSQTRTCPLLAPDAIRLPSAEYATAQISLS